MGRKRVYTVKTPQSGVLLKWGREDPGADPDLVTAWAPGSKRAAYCLMTLISDNRAALEEAGVDITTLHQSTEAPRGSRTGGTPRFLVWGHVLCARCRLPHCP